MKKLKKHSLLVGLLTALLLSPMIRGEEKPVVATLHPLMSEMVERLTDGEVEIFDVFPSGGDVHVFEPSPGDLVQMQEAVLVIAMGKHLEGYLGRLRENLPASVEIYEAGRLVPSVKIDPGNEVFACCPAHSHGAIDPHWWHSPMAMRRAVRYLGRELERVLPEQKKEIRERTRELMDELNELNEWGVNALAVIPKQDRKLVTAHAAFGYFCVEYNFQAVPVKGLNDERNPSPTYLAETIDVLKREKVKAVFPETKANDAILKSLHESTGIRLGKPLFADYIGNKEVSGYVDIFKTNIHNIVTALGPDPSE
ncbi:metal ABC transporter substrate-binding protein [Kiritimatiellaeota bacterium B1221]|nr:metal ABC transporter substrate-binding protein [Kiritimatiellaeota bacterium B1221]